MESYQWFLLGMMAAWMPGMIILAVALWRAPDESEIELGVRPLGSDVGGVRRPNRPHVNAD